MKTHTSTLIGSTDGSDSYSHHFVTGLDLDIGNNPRDVYQSLVEIEEFRDWVLYGDTSLADIATVSYKGNYGKYRGCFSLSDLADYARYEEKMANREAERMASISELLSGYYEDDEVCDI